MSTKIKVGDPIILTWEENDEREVTTITEVRENAVYPGLHTGIRDDLPQWDPAQQAWIYCYGKNSGS